MRCWVAWIALLSTLAIAGCGRETPAPANGGGAERSTGSPPAAKGDRMATPRGSIEVQLELLRAKDVEALKACFTPRLRDRITEATVDAGAKGAASVTLEDLVAKVEKSEFEGRPTAEITMKNGRTLTTLVLLGGRWLADTLWFR